MLPDADMLPAREARAGGALARGCAILGADVTPNVAGSWERWTAVTDEPLVLATIERARDTWLTAERIAVESGLPLERVQAVLDAARSDIILAPAREPGQPPRYSTGAHYRATNSILRRFLDALKHR
jgi:hypothetical protein